MSRMTEGEEGQVTRKEGGVAARLGLSGLEYRIPPEANRWQYMLGGLTAFLLVLLIATGLYLGQFYNPNPIGAHDSVLYIMTRAPLGEWIRNLHYWAAGGVVVTLVAHLALTFWRRAYRAPRELTWWAGLGLAALVFLLLVTGTALRYDQEGYEALAHFVAGGELTGAIGALFTEGFTSSTTLLARIYAMHTSLLPLALVGLLGLHLWLVRHLGIKASGEPAAVFRDHVTKLTGAALLAFALIGLLAVVVPEGLGYPPVGGVEVTKPFWPLLWVYGLENQMGMWGMIVGPAVVAGLLALVPVLDRRREPETRSRWLTWLVILLGLAISALWIYGALGAGRQHLGM